VRMTRHDKALRRILSGISDQSIRFEHLCLLLVRLGFDERRTGGSHRIFTKHGVVEILNLQSRPDGTAKPYQVRQARELIEKYRLGSFDGEDTRRER